MMDIFETKNIKPMLIGSNQEAFDSPDYIYELKLDGIRCIAYLDNNGVDLRNKRNIKLLQKYPELNAIHKQIRKKCILDGELIVIKNGVPNFFEVQRRSLMNNTFKINLSSKDIPASFTAYDILYYEDYQVIDMLLMERKKLLEKNIIESERLAISRYIEERGIDFFNLTKEQELEGIVAKKKDSKYYFDKRTKDWIKIKYLQDNDFAICGYRYKSSNMINIILGQYKNGSLIYKGSVPISKSSRDFSIIQETNAIDLALFNSEEENIIWIEPFLVCTVEYMMLTGSGSMRQPVFKGLRIDKSATDCLAP